MTTQYAVFSGLPTGLTLTKKVFTVADPDVEVTGITGAITERTNAKGQYTVAVTKAAVITGIHTIILFVGSTPIAIGKRTFAGTDAETAVETAVLAELDSASITAVQSGLATASSVAAIDTKIGTPEMSLSAMVGNVPTIAEFEARTLAAASYRQNISLRGTDMTEAKAFDLLLAASAGVTSQPSSTTEKFKFLDGNDAFTTTFDTNGNRTGVSLA